MIKYLLVRLFIGENKRQIVVVKDTEETGAER